MWNHASVCDDEMVAQELGLTDAHSEDRPEFLRTGQNLSSDFLGAGLSQDGASSKGTKSLIGWGWWDDRQQHGMWQWIGMACCYYGHLCRCTFWCRVIVEHLVGNHDEWWAFLMDRQVRTVQYHGVSCRSTENDHHSFWLPFAGGAYQICKFRTHLSSLSPLRMGLQQHQSSTTTPQQHQSSTITTSILFSLQYYSSNNNNYYHDQCEFPQLV